MKTVIHQRYAAQCRHAKSAEAKRQYWRALSEKFNTRFDSQSGGLREFAARERCVIEHRLASLCDALDIKLKSSTFQAWLREWWNKRQDV